MRKLFYGGVHPDARKELAPPDSVHAVAPPALAVVPLRQHIGQACRPLVKPGDAVRKGQRVGDGEGLCVPVHAPVSGIVREIAKYPHATLGRCEAIVIENDGRETPADTEPHGDPSSLTPSELEERIRLAGVAGMGGATFSTAVKLASAAGAVDTLIVNACECEPYITADDALLCTQPELVVRGAQMLSASVGAKRTVIAIEDNKVRAAEAVRAVLPSGMELKILPTRYPQGAEKQLIQAVTGREAAAGKLPRDVGCAVFNAATCAASVRAAFDGEPLIERIVTVSGEGVKHPGNYLVRIGTPIADVLAAAGGLADDGVRVLAGGPMMGFAVDDFGAPVTKGVNAVTCLPRKTAAQLDGTVCFRCGRCVAACPMHLRPLYFFRGERCGDAAMLEHDHVCDCIECGCCAYACPGHLPLVRAIRAGKQLVKECAVP